MEGIIFVRGNSPRRRQGSPPQGRAPEKRAGQALRTHAGRSAHTVPKMRKIGTISAGMRAKYAMSYPATEQPGNEKTRRPDRKPGTGI